MLVISSLKRKTRISAKLHNASIVLTREIYLVTEIQSVNELYNKKEFIFSSCGTLVSTILAFNFSYLPRNSPPFKVIYSSDNAIARLKIK